jgi:hypothetical protein
VTSDVQREMSVAHMDVEAIIVAQWDTFSSEGDVYCSESQRLTSLAQRMTAVA